MKSHADTKGKTKRDRGTVGKPTRANRSQQPVSTGNEPSRSQIDGDEGQDDGGVETESPDRDIRGDRDVERERP